MPVTPCYMQDADGGEVELKLDIGVDDPFSGLCVYLSPDVWVRIPLIGNAIGTILRKELKEVE